MRSALAGILFSISVFAAPAQATVYTFIGSFSGAAENPANASTGAGSAIVMIDDVLKTLSVDFKFAQLISPSTVAHIHCCAATPLNNAGVATQTPTFAGFPAGVTAGSYASTFDMTTASSWNAAFITNNGGTVETAFQALLLGLIGGRAYANIHSSQFTGGEIRANLVQTPLPAAVWLFGGALALAGFGTRRRSASNK